MNRKLDANKLHVFIVCHSHEVDLAQAFKELLDIWGLKAFYFKQRDRAPTETWRRDLALKLKNAGVAMLLLSPEFQWSPYCQAEAGATAILDVNSGRKPIVIAIPPVEIRNISTVSPVLEVFQAMDASDLASPDSLGEFFTTLKARLFSEGNIPGEHDPNYSFEHERAARAKIADEVDRIKERYDQNVPPKALMGVWPSIDLKPGNGRDSIVNSIKSSLSNDNRVTKLSFVGVSLKYSILILNRALESFSTEVYDEEKHIQRRGPRATKSLEITLVYMDANSHILHSLDDKDDINCIYDTLNLDWDTLLETWEKYCIKSNVTFIKPTVCRIDYIPPRVGILIDNHKLYAGRCSIEQDDIGRHHLLVGETEYYYFSKTDELDKKSDRGTARITEFTDAIRAYSNKTHNGARLVCDEEQKNQWIEGLEQCARRYPGIDKITVISETGTKFRKLISIALKKGINVQIHVLAPEGASQKAIDAIDGLDRFLDGFRNQTHQGIGTPTMYRCLPQTTFRAVLIGERVLGFQMYEPNLDKEPGDSKPSPIRLIVSQDSAHYEFLKAMVLEFLTVACH